MKYFEDTAEQPTQPELVRLISAANQLNVGARSEYFSKDDFVSTIGGTILWSKRSTWVDSLTHYFSMRERQHLEPLEVRVAALTPSLALMTSEENFEIWMTGDEQGKYKHVFTMIWKKEHDGWKILHSHESWSKK